MGWIFTVLLGLAFGFTCVRFLSVHPMEIGSSASMACLSGFLLVLVVSTSFSGWDLVGAGVISLAAFVCSYAWATRRLLGREDDRAVPTMIRKKGDPGNGHTAVVYFTHGEPETYNPIGWLNQFREFDERKTAFIPWLIRPYFIYQLRKAYLKVGMSRHRAMHQQMMRRLADQYSSHDFRFYLCFLDDEPRPDAAVIRALNEGSSRIVVAEVFVSISNHTAEGESLVKSVKAKEFVPLRFTGPLWDSALLQRMFVEKANTARGSTAKDRVGVILVGHGQPDEWDQEFPSETEHETLFRQGIMDRLVEDGYPRENLGLAWMEFKRPRPAEKVEELARRGLEKILYFSAAISADSIHSQYDVPELISKASIPEGIELINMGAWNDHPLAIAAIQEKIDAELSHFEFSLN